MDLFAARERGLWNRRCPVRVRERRRRLMTELLAGRVAIVTGANGGLGVALCGTLCDHGARVLPVDVVGSDCFLADVGTSDGNRSMVDEAIERFGRLDILALNAGAQFMSPIPEFPEPQWDHLMSVMAKGPYLA